MAQQGAGPTAHLDRPSRSERRRTVEQIRDYTEAGILPRAERDERMRRALTASTRQLLLRLTDPTPLGDAEAAAASGDAALPAGRPQAVLAAVAVAVLVAVGGVAAFLLAAPASDEAPPPEAAPLGPPPADDAPAPVGPGLDPSGVPLPPLDVRVGPLLPGPLTDTQASVAATIYLELVRLADTGTSGMLPDQLCPALAATYNGPALEAEVAARTGGLTSYTILSTTVESDRALVTWAGNGGAGEVGPWTLELVEDGDHLLVCGAHPLGTQ